MAKIFFNLNTTKNRIEDAPAKDQGFTRGYLGFSSIGHKCARALFYGFRFASRKKITPRMARIFERGDIEESRVIRDLKSIGIEVFRRDGDQKIELTGEIGEKQETLLGFAGHAKGHPDGRMLGVIEAPKTEHLLEIKTMNDSRFKNFQKNGVQVSDPIYYSQMQRLMKAMGLKRGMIIATNKNTEEREYERVYYDKDHAELLCRKEESIIVTNQPPADKFSRASFECKFCDHKAVCHDSEPPVKTCRSCEYVDLAFEGKWLCSFYDDKELSLDDQIKACRNYRRLF